MIADTFRRAQDAAEAASWALRNVSAITASHSVSGEQEACEAVFSALQSHMANPLTTEQHFAAVVNLTVENNLNIQIFYAIGLCEVLADAMKLHSKVVETCIQMSWALQIMCAIPTINKRAGDLGMCESIVGILRRHISNTESSTRACLAISEVTELYT